MNYKLDVELSPELELYRSAIEATIKPYIKIKLTDNNNPTWWQSKFGGFPYMPKDFAYPKSDLGEYLYLLAQINFAEVPHFEGLPKQGILQFYLGVDKEFYYGCDLDNPFNQDKFRVIYFSNVDLSEENLLTDFSFIPPDSDYYLPFEGCSAISFKAKCIPISPDDYRFNLFTIERNLSNDDKYRQLMNAYRNLFNFDGHKLLGYPYFTQDDPRPHLQEEEEYILLLQIDNGGHKTGFSIQWGDFGIGNFFIKQSDLDKLDFSQVLYNWDCH